MPMTENLPYYKLRRYKPRNLTEQQLRFCEAYLAEGIASRAAKMAGYKSPNRNAAALLQCKRILDYLNKREKQLTWVPITFEYKIDKLAKVIERSIPDEIDNGQLLMADYKAGISAIAEANKMQGHYTPTQIQQTTIEASCEDIRNSRLAYKKEY